jgi:four helix bundle protein
MLDCYRVSLSMISSLKSVVPAIAKYDRDLANQLQRAASSVVLNVAEGRLRQGGDQRRSFQIAAGSCNEVKAALDVAETWGWVTPTDELRSYIERCLSMLWRMTHPR